MKRATQHTPSLGTMAQPNTPLHWVLWPSRTNGSNGKCNRTTSLTRDVDATKHHWQNLRQSKCRAKSVPKSFRFHRREPRGAVFRVLRNAFWPRALQLGGKISKSDRSRNSRRSDHGGGRDSRKHTRQIGRTRNRG